MRRIRKSKKAAFIVIALLLLISIGYAALTTNLTIGGSSTVKKQTFNVYFNNVQVNQSSVSGAKVTTAPSVPANSTSTTTLTWAVTLDTPGEFYEFNVDIVNGGTIDAMVNTATNNIVSTLTQAQRAYLDYTVTYVNGAAIERYDKLAVGETKTITVRLEFKQDVNPGDLPAEGETGISLSFSSDYVPADTNAVEKVTTVAQVTPPEIGNAVDYSTTLNGVTLNNWKVFYVDGDYTYIILGDYLPSAAIIDTLKTAYTDDHIDSFDDYGIWCSDRQYVINGATTTAHWAGLINNGSMSGTPLSSDVKNNENVYAMGSPTIDLWVNSWNSEYPDSWLYTRYIEEDEVRGDEYGSLEGNEMGNQYWDTGYVYGYTEHPYTYSINFSGTAAYAIAEANNVYFPHKQKVSDGDGGYCNAYFIGSPGVQLRGAIIRVEYDGTMYGGDYENTDAAYRPIIKLPSSVIKLVE